MEEELKASTSLLRLIKNGLELRSRDTPNGSYVRTATFQKKLKAHNRYKDAPNGGQYFPITLQGLKDALDYAFPDFILYKR